MRRPFASVVFFLLVMLWLLTGCGGPSAPVLPTATPMPTQAIPTSTATFLPPPTVTLYPTPTPRNGLATIPVSDTQPAGSEASPGAAGEPSSLPQPTVPPTPTDTATPTPFPTPTPTPTPTIVALPSGMSLGGLIYASDFSGGWPTFNDPTAKIAVVNGQYHFEIGPFDGRFLTTTAVNHSDFYEQVEVTPEACPQKAGYGLMFRYKDPSNYYLLTVFCDSSYAAIAKVGGSVIGMTNGNLPAGMDSAKTTVHTVGVLAKADTFTLYIGGQSISSFTDAQLKQGDVAIYAVSQGAQVLKVDFDNWKVWTIQTQ